jgi:hypothetical protein
MLEKIFIDLRREAKAIFKVVVGILLVILEPALRLSLC